MARRLVTLLLTTLLLAPLVGCGQKGPLYLPDEPSTASDDQTAQQPAQD